MYGIRAEVAAGPPSPNSAACATTATGATRAHHARRKHRTRSRKKRRGGDATYAHRSLCDVCAVRDGKTSQPDGIAMCEKSHL